MPEHQPQRSFAFGLAACSDDNPVDTDDDNEMGNLGSGDVGVLNYAYALEQLEAAFYIAVLDSAYSGMSTEEGQLLEDLRKHVVAHRDWLQAAITSVAPDGIIPGLTPDFSSVDFSVNGAFDPFNNYEQFLALSQAFEDTGVRAYKGQAPAVQGNAQILTAALAIHSVEARHASEVRRLRG